MVFYINLKVLKKVLNARLNPIFLPKIFSSKVSISTQIVLSQWNKMFFRSLSIPEKHRHIYIYNTPLPPLELWAHHESHYRITSTSQTFGAHIKKQTTTNFTCNFLGLPFPYRFRTLYQSPPQKKTDTSWKSKHNTQPQHRPSAPRNEGLN